MRHLSRPVQTLPVRATAESAAPSPLVHHPAHAPPSAHFWYDPAWPVVVESRRASQSRACYRPHSHPSVSIGVVDRGHSVFTGADGRAHALTVGALVVVPAQVVHACNPAAGQAWSYQMLHLDAAWWRQLRGECGLAPDGAELLVHSDAPALYRAFDALNGQLFDLRRTRQDKEAALVAFLVGRLWPAQGATPHEAATAQADLQPLLQDLAQGEGPLPGLAELAQRVGLSRFQLIRHFHRSSGLTPHAWLLNQRIARARTLLRTDPSGAGTAVSAAAGPDLADLALRLGFADQSHFQRVFKAHVGVTPHRYRRRRA